MSAKPHQIDIGQFSSAQLRSDQDAMQLHKPLGSCLEYLAYAYAMPCHAMQAGRLGQVRSASLGDSGSSSSQQGPGSSKLGFGSVQVQVRFKRAVFSGARAQMVGTLSVSFRVRTPQQKEAHLLSVRKRTLSHIRRSLSLLLSLQLISRPETGQDNASTLSLTNGTSGNLTYLLRLGYNTVSAIRLTTHPYPYVRTKPCWSHCTCKSPSW